MKLCVLVPAALLMFALQSLGTTISFNELQTGEDVLDYYNGGFGSLGTGPGPSYDVTFSPGWIVSPPDVYGLPTGKSASLSGVATMNVSAGWFGPTSFYYSGSGLVVDFYSLENGAGTLVGSLNLPGETFFYPAGQDLPLFRSAVFYPVAPTRIDALTNGFLVIAEPSALKLFLFGITVISLAALYWKRLLDYRTQG